ncbi:hypothetical protein QBC38DRAFT_57939 [Podospora fimiseda]|uniref:Uncharacterized protein n=1 Tax=Podospora fimiseda TaxID=252190 RepID=A0AAN7BGY0_9PEZI|nr:hypothetical protein QBC38DRAFT_57939 [Podospora fimiseda]
MIMSSTTWPVLATVFTVEVLRDSPEFSKIVRPRTGFHKKQALQCIEHLENVKGHIRWIDHHAAIGRSPCQYRNQGIPRDLFVESMKLINYAERTLKEFMNYHKKHFESIWGAFLHWFFGTGSREHRLDQYNDRLHECALWINVVTLTMVLRANYDAARHDYRNVLVESKRYARLLQEALGDIRSYAKRYPEKTRHVYEKVELAVFEQNAKVVEDELYWISFSRLTTPSGTTLGNTTSPSPPLLSRRQMRQKAAFVAVDVGRARYHTIVIEEEDSDTSQYSGYSRTGQYYQTMTGDAFMSGAIPSPWNGQQQPARRSGPLPTPQVITIEPRPPLIVEARPPPETREPGSLIQERPTISRRVVSRESSHPRSKSPSLRRDSSRVPSTHTISHRVVSRQLSPSRSRSPPRQAPSRAPPTHTTSNRVISRDISRSRSPSPPRVSSRAPSRASSTSRHSDTPRGRSTSQRPPERISTTPIRSNSRAPSSTQPPSRPSSQSHPAHPPSTPIRSQQQPPRRSSRPQSSYRAPSSSSHRQSSSRASSTQRTEDSGYVSMVNSNAPRNRREARDNNNNKYPPISGKFVRRKPMSNSGSNSRDSSDSGVAGMSEDERDRRKRRKREVMIEVERRSREREEEEGGGGGRGRRR